MPTSPLQLPLFSAKDSLREAVISLKRAHIETAALDARILLQHVMGISHERLLAEESLALTPGQYASYQKLIGKRGRRCPVAQLIGSREFYGRRFKVTEHTLDPRPDSETLIEAVLEWAGSGKAKPFTLLDFGTGTGCLLLTLLKEMSNARGVGVDISKEALSVARENAIGLELQERASFRQQDWNQNIQGTFDIIVANPPYILTRDIAALEPEVSQYEPRLALDGGNDGLDAYRTIMPKLPGLLNGGGIAAFEIGMGQEEEVRKIVAGGLGLVTSVKKDLAGIPRCILLSLATSTSHQH